LPNSGSEKRDVKQFYFTHTLNQDFNRRESNDTAISINLHPGQLEAEVPAGSNSEIAT
jgi:hypothetical protein